MSAYLDDVIVFDSDLIAHVQTIRSRLERVGEHNLKLSTSKTDWVPQMRTSWATPSPQRAYARTQKTCQHW